MSYPRASSSCPWESLVGVKFRSGVFVVMITGTADADPPGPFDLKMNVRFTGTPPTPPTPPVRIVAKGLGLGLEPEGCDEKVGLEFSLPRML